MSKALGGIALADDFDAQIRALPSLAFDYAELRTDYVQHLYQSKHIPGTERLDYDVSFPVFCQQLNELILSDKSACKIATSIAVEPGNINDRLVAQKGKFTVSGGKMYYYEGERSKDDALFDRPKFLCENGENNDTDHLAVFVIPGDCKEAIRKDLELVLGIDVSSFMLDMNSDAEMAARRLSGSD